MPELERLVREVEEPYDQSMTMVFAVYLAARRAGIKALLDGIDGDNLLSEGSHFARLLRRGRWLAAYHAAVGHERFWGNDYYPAWRELWRSARAAFVPQPLRRLRGAMRFGNRERLVRHSLRTTLIAPAFARRIDLASRLEALAAHRPPGLLPDFCRERARDVLHPYLTIGVERYNRVASSLGVEPRLPFLDRRVVEFCVALPSGQKFADGWPKAILRRAMAGRLPDAVRWRRGKEHLGWACTTAFMKLAQLRLQAAIEANSGIISPYVDLDALRRACRAYFEAGDMERADKVYEAASLGVWLRRHAERPRAVL
jgi:asparagine synthase (glutamine-hydrolysing)